MSFARKQQSICQPAQDRIDPMSSAERPKILLVEDDEFALENLELTFYDQEYEIATAATGTNALEQLREKFFNAIVTDVKLPGMDGISVIEECRKLHPDTKYVVITGYADEGSVLRALKLGVNDFLKKPYHNEELLSSVRQLLEMQRLEWRNRDLQERLAAENSMLRKISVEYENENARAMAVGNSPAIRKCLAQAEKVGRYGVNAMIRGESGSGKEVFANYIHTQGARAAQPFVPVNCAALSATLIEAELFGYEKGAFTGAKSPHAGLFEVADGGILFLDELTEIPIELQAKLLRVVETQRCRRVGSNTWRDIDVQILCATNREVHEALEQKHLREDLYHRLATTELFLPPLRDRMEDFRMLLEHFVRKYQTQFGHEFPPISAEVRDFLERHEWRGNIRQLSNFVKQWYMFGDSAGIDEIKRWFNVAARQTADTELGKVLRFDFVEGTMSELEQAKEILVKAIVRQYNGSISKSARHLGLSYPGLKKMLDAFESKAASTQ